MANTYWENRAKEADANLRKIEDLGIGEVEKISRELSASIEREIEKFYRMYAENVKDDSQLTLNQFAKSLLKGKDLTDWKSATIKILNDIQRQNYQITQSQKALLSRLRITREEAFLQSFQNLVTLNAVKEEKNLKNTILNIFSAKKDFDEFAISQDSGILVDFEKLSKPQVESILSQKYLEKNYSERIWDNRDKLVLNLNSVARRGFLLGESVDKISKTISKNLGTSLSNATRLIRTESGIAAAKADEITYKDAGIEKFEFLAFLDEKTCPICGALDGKTFEVKDTEIGVNTGPLHANCRCTTIPKVDTSDLKEEKLAKDSEGNYVRVSKKLSLERWQAFKLLEQSKTAETGEIPQVIKIQEKEKPGVFKTFSEKILKPIGREVIWYGKQKIIRGTLRYAKTSRNTTIRMAGNLGSVLNFFGQKGTIAERIKNELKYRSYDAIQKELLQKFVDFVREKYVNTGDIIHAQTPVIDINEENSKADAKNEGSATSKFNDEKITWEFEIPAKSDVIFAKNLKNKLAKVSLKAGTEFQITGITLSEDGKSFNVKLRVVKQDDGFPTLESKTDDVLESIAKTDKTIAKADTSLTSTTKSTIVAKKDASEKTKTGVKLTEKQIKERASIKKYNGDVVGELDENLSLENLYAISNAVEDYKHYFYQISPDFIGKRVGKISFVYDENIKDFAEFDPETKNIKIGKKLSSSDRKDLFREMAKKVMNSYNDDIVKALGLEKTSAYVIAELTAGTIVDKYDLDDFLMSIKKYSAKQAKKLKNKYAELSPENFVAEAMANEHYNNYYRLKESDLIGIFISYAKAAANLTKLDDIYDMFVPDEAGEDFFFDEEDEEDFFDEDDEEGFFRFQEDDFDEEDLPKNPRVEFLKAVKEQEEKNKKSKYKISPESFFKNISKLTPEEYVKINNSEHGYIGTTNGFNINDYLRDELDEIKIVIPFESFEKATKYVVKNMDNVISKNKLKQDTALFRAVTNRYLDNLIGKETDWDEVLSNADSLKKIKKKIEGKTFKEKGYMSATAAFNSYKELDVLDSRNVHINVSAPKGTPAFTTTNYDEWEVILKRNLKYKVNRFESVGGGKVEMDIEILSD